MAIQVSNDVTYYMNTRIIRKVNRCINCKTENAGITSAHYPGKHFCTIGCLWKYDAVEKKTIKNFGLPQGNRVK